MNFQVDVTSSLSNQPATPLPQVSSGNESIDLLRQLLDVQREQLAVAKAAAAAHDQTNRWRGFLSRWQGDYPELGENCRKAVPVLERTYGQLIKDLTDRLNDDGDPVDNDFALQEFLDRYGMRLAQLGTILNLVAPLAEASGTGETS